MALCGFGIVVATQTLNSELRDHLYKAVSQWPPACMFAGCLLIMLDSLSYVAVSPEMSHVLVLLLFFVVCHVVGSRSR